MVRYWFNLGLALAKISSPDLAPVGTARAKGRAETAARSKNFMMNG